MFPNLKAEMARYGITVVDIARAIRKTRQNASGKLNGTGEFTLTEIVSIRDKFFPGMSLDVLCERELEAEGEKKRPA